MKKIFILVVVLLGISFYGCEKSCELIPKTGFDIVGSDENCYYSPNIGTFTDVRDNTVYNWVKIGNQAWMTENLKYLPSVSGPSSGSETVPYYYVYDYYSTNVNEAKATSIYAAYGVLYNWPAAMAGAGSSSANPSSVKGVCPEGWHLPSDAEWTELANYLESDAGGKLKEMGTVHWHNPNVGATNETGFTALGGGYRYGDGAYFNGLKAIGYWWTATEYDAMNSRNVNITYDSPTIKRDHLSKELGFSVRCVRD